MAYLLVNCQFFLHVGKIFEPVRFDDFPIKLHSTTVIMVHWLTIWVPAPLGIFQGLFALLAIVGYAFITLTLFFSRNG